MAFGGKAGAAPASAQSLAEQFTATLSAHDMAAFAALLAEGYVNHRPAPPCRHALGWRRSRPPSGSSPRGWPGCPTWPSASRRWWPAAKAAASYVYEGTHTGPYLGVAPTGPLRFTSCDIFAVRGGQIAEHWGMGDLASTLAQMRG